MVWVTNGSIEGQEDKQEETKEANTDFTQNLIATISQYETLTASLKKDDPLRGAYREVVESLKKQLLTATQKKPTQNNREKQVPIDQSFNQLSMSEIVGKFISINYTFSLPIECKRRYIQRQSNR